MISDKLTIEVPPEWTRARTLLRALMAEIQYRTDLKEVSRLRAVRRSRGVSACQCARELHVWKGSVTRYELGAVVPGPAVAARIAAWVNR